MNDTDIDSTKVTMSDHYGHYRITHEDACLLRIALRTYKKRVAKGNVPLFFMDDELADIRRLRKIFKEGEKKYANG